VNAADSDDVLLSREGAARRDAILADALRTADRRRHWRALRRVAAAACIGAIAFGTVASVYRSTHRPTHLQSPGRIATSAPSTVPAAIVPEHLPRIVVQIIPADDVDRKWQVINDDQLLAALADAGKPAGIARVNGKAVLVPIQ
jgi:hypothetical protein